MIQSVDSICIVALHILPHILKVDFAVANFLALPHYLIFVWWTGVLPSS